MRRSGGPLGPRWLAAQASRARWPGIAATGTLAGMISFHIPINVDMRQIEYVPDLSRKGKFTKKYDD